MSLEEYSSASTSVGKMIRKQVTRMGSVRSRFGSKASRSKSGGSLSKQQQWARQGTSAQSRILKLVATASATIGDLACEALGRRGVNLHTTSALRPILEHFWLVKVDMEWAGRLLFLAHPSLAGRPQERAEVLRRAREEDLVFVLRGQGLESTSVRHSAAVEEFVAWAKQMISRGKRICVELTVDARDENCAFALERCLALGLDVLGEHAAHFCFQGGPCGAKAFEASELAGSARAEAR